MYYRCSQVNAAQRPAVARRILVVALLALVVDPTFGGFGAPSVLARPHEQLTEGVRRDTRQPRIEVSKTVFPASKTCRLPARLADQCPDPILTEFTLTYTVGTDITWSEKAELRTAFAYRYNGTYRTEKVYTENFSWPNLQTTDPTANNYVSARVVNQGAAVSIEVLPETFGGQLLLRLQSLTPPVLSPGDQIEIRFGDTRLGSPGYLVPPIAHNADLIVQHDADNDRVFELVDADMPVLSVIGTDVETIEVVAPSTPRSTFRIVVKAMQGKDGLMENMYRVQEFGGTVRFSSSDPLAVLPDDYTFQPEDEGTKTFWMTMLGEGMQHIDVQDVNSGITGRSNPILIEPKPSDQSAVERRSDAREARPISARSFAETGKNIYWGSVHQHTNVGGHAVETGEFAYHYGRHVSRLDFLAVSEHCERTDFDWQHVQDLANQFYVPDEFVTFAAHEWSTSTYGHRHIIYRHPSNHVPLCSENNNNPTTQIATTIDELLSGLRTADVLMLLHHTAWKYPVAIRNPDTDGVVFGDINQANQTLFEVYSHHGSSEKFDNAPYTIHGDLSHQWEAARRVYFQDALADGYKFGVTADGDNHHGKPGGHLGSSLGENGEQYSRLGLTAVRASALTRDGVWEALRARRTYGTTGARIILDYSINGREMGEEVMIDGAPTIRVAVVGTDAIRTISVIKDGYDSVFETRPSAVSAGFEFTDEAAREGATHSYYVRVIQNDDHYAWSSPIWVTVESQAADRPRSFSIGATVPNPFNGSASIRFTLSQTSLVSADVYNVNGKHICTLAKDREFLAGDNAVTWDGFNDTGARAASGVYLIRIKTPIGEETARTILLK